jgi:hypothetical protein
MRLAVTEKKLVRLEENLTQMWGRGGGCYMYIPAYLLHGSGPLIPKLYVEWRQYDSCEACVNKYCVFDCLKRLYRSPHGLKNTNEQFWSKTGQLKRLYFSSVLLIFSYVLTDVQGADLVEGILQNCLSGPYRNNFVSHLPNQVRCLFT